MLHEQPNLWLTSSRPGLWPSNLLVAGALGSCLKPAPDNCRRQHRMGLFCLTMKDRDALDEQELSSLSAPVPSCLSFCFLPLWVFLPVLQCLQLTTSETATSFFTLFKTPEEAPRQDFLIYSHALFLSHHTRPTDEHDAHIGTAFVSIWSTAPGVPKKEQLRNTVFPLCEGFQPFYFTAAGSTLLPALSILVPHMLTQIWF